MTTFTFIDYKLNVNYVRENNFNAMITFNAMIIIFVVNAYTGNHVKCW